MATEQPNSEPNFRQITSQEFIDIITLKDENKYAEFYGSYNYYSRAILIKGVETEEIELGEGVIVSLPLIIENGYFKGFTIQGGTFQSDFRIEGGTFQNGFLINYGTFQSDFRIQGGLFRNGFRIQGGTFQNEVKIRGGTFQDDFRIQGGTFQSGFWTQGGIYQTDFRIQGGIFQSDFWLHSGTFQGEFWLHSGTFEEGFWIQGGTFQNGCLIDGGTFLKVLRISGGIFYNDLLISGGTFQDNFKIQGGTFDKSLIFENGIINYLTIEKLTSKINLDFRKGVVIDVILICDTIPKDSLFRFANSPFVLEFNAVQNYGQIIFNDASATLEPFIPEKPSPKVVSQSSPIRPELRIINSDLGKANLINSDLSGFDLVFKSSKITDVFVTGTKMPRQITTTFENGQPDFRQHQLGYSQIKKIYEARGDRVEANRYYAREMEAYQNTLSWLNWDDFWEKVNLSLNKYSTNYGQSWQRGVGTTLLVTIIFYSIYCWCLGYWPTWPNKDSFNKLSTLIPYVLEFLNPIHKADYVAEQLLGESISIPGSARLVEGLSRIFVTYFVYQLVQAFRKHGKSGG